jgi:hypothetical protein
MTQGQICNEISVQNNELKIVKDKLPNMERFLQHYLKAPKDYHELRDYTKQKRPIRKYLKKDKQPPMLLPKRPSALRTNTRSHSPSVQYPV